VTPWNFKVDLAYPCATQNELPLEDAQLLVKNGCIGVFEGANMPTTDEALTFIREKKIFFSPGKASNAGGVATSGLEMSQNSQRLYWTRDEVDYRLKMIMKSIHNNCEEYGRESKDYVDYVKGANIAGFVKVADAMIAQGVV
jgi:glutamate dehydrogenase (NADP+)